jgi:amino acid transporter
MWLILNCFIDGLSVMAYGKELTYSQARKQTKVDKVDGWAEICHFNLHSDNSQPHPVQTFTLMVMLIQKQFLWENTT